MLVRAFFSSDPATHNASYRVMYDTFAPRFVAIWGE